ncbi:class F sortase [Plantactinospora sp. B5E13]|uniref:class F sortase n=1 Tax=unclassified Plantactinospora TaxID=2631981 RepID=UPI00325EC147
MSTARRPRLGGRRPAPHLRHPAARGGPAARQRRSTVGPLAVILVLVGVFATGAGLGRSADGPWWWLNSGSKAPPYEFPVLEPSRPVRLEIPSIKVEAPVHRVGLAEDGTIAVPDLDRHNEAGWYDRGPTPGQFGPAIIVGHADTRTGPSVFHDLAKLRAGARIEVVRQDRSVAIFEVNSVERFDKDALPAERVYGDYQRPWLRLITCGGRWVGGSTGYADNIVVFASLVDSRDR